MPPSPPDSGSAEHVARAEALLDILHGNWKTQAVCVAAELRLAELLADGPRTAEDLAATAGVHVQALHRLLRALTTLDLCTELVDGRFQITATGALLATDSPGSLRSWALWWASHLGPVWQHLLYSIKTGQSARQMLMGAEGFEHLQRDTDTATLFHRALADLTRLTAQNVVHTYDFAGLKQIVDVGGGYGELLTAILNAHPTTTGILFDQPHAITGAQAAVAQAGLADRCQCVAGDFFESVPAGGDAYLLKTILHDWTDADARRILVNCRHAMSPSARLLIIEQVLPDRLTNAPAHQSNVRSDLNMLVALGAGERTQARFRQLLHDAGLRQTRVLPAGRFFTVIEAQATA
ncbi:MAG: methyltransferase [Phycisphaeraceae bacterium]